MRDGGPVYPQILTTYETCRECEGSGRIGYGDVCLRCGGTGKEKWTGEHPGMSLRDHFAAAALQGMCANPPVSGEDHYVVSGISRYAYLFADAMLKAREGDNG